MKYFNICKDIKLKIKFYAQKNGQVDNTKDKQKKEELSCPQIYNHIN